MCKHERRVLELERELDGCNKAREELESRILHQDTELHGLHARIEKLEGQLSEPTELERVATRLADRLEIALGIERYDETSTTHGLFRAIEDVRDVLRKPPSLSEDFDRLVALRRSALRTGT